MMRGRGMKRCRAEGAERFALFVGAAVLANNLIITGQLRNCRLVLRRRSPAEFGKFIVDEAEKWGKMARAANIKVQ